MIPYAIKLPCPPPLSEYYGNAPRRAANGRRYNGKRITEAGTAFRRATLAAARTGHRLPPRLSGPLSIAVLVNQARFTSNGRRNGAKVDLDNLFKCLLDALKFAGIILDDSQFDDIRMVRGDRADPAQVSVMINRFDPGSALSIMAEAWT